MWSGIGRAAALACAVLCLMPAAAGQVRAVDAAVFVGEPTLSDPLLSPDGARIAARAVVAGAARLAIFDAMHPEAAPRPVPLPQAERLEWYRWTGVDTLLVSLVREDAEPMTRLASVDLTRGVLTQIGAARRAGFGDEILHIDPAGAFALLKTQAARDTPPAVQRIDLRTGQASLAVAPQRDVWNWVADSAGVVRAGLASKGDRSWMVYRQGEGDRFNRAAGGGRPIDQFVPVRGSDMGYALAEAPSGRMAIYAYDFRRGRTGRLLYENARVDVDGFETGPAGQLTGVEYSDARDETLWFDAASARRQAAIDAALPGRVNRVASASADDSRLLVFSRSAGDPGVYYVYAGGRAVRFAAVNPALPETAAGQMRAIRYRARDGLEIHGFLTLPAGRAAAGLPLIVMPHGGPFARDSWGYDPWVQYLAAKGYAVLQPNYRGSAGFGDAFIAKGDGEWGRGMQDDLADGVAWLSGQGTIDAHRVCIMGASYGGYAAMWAAARESGRYRCAISFAGISDIQAQLDFDHRTFEERDYRAWKRRIQGSAPSLAALSPISFVDSMRMPLLIAHGDADDVVPPDQSVALHRALAARGTAHEYAVYKGEGHNLDDPADSVDFLTRVGAFLDRHNPS